MTEEDLRKVFDLKSKIGILKRISKGARSLAAISFVFVQLIRNCIAFNDLFSWLNLALFAYKAFHIPRRDRKCDSEDKSLVSRVKENISTLHLRQSIII